MLIWRFGGNGASVIRIIRYTALHFMTNESNKCWILQNCPMLGSGSVVDFLAGSTAGGTSVLCTYPLDLARTKLAYQVVDARSIMDNMKDVLPLQAHNGIKELPPIVTLSGSLVTTFDDIKVEDADFAAIQVSIPLAEPPRPILHHRSCLSTLAGVTAVSVSSSTTAIPTPTAVPAAAAAACSSARLSFVHPNVPAIKALTFHAVDPIDPSWSALIRTLLTFLSRDLSIR
ncbi:uncharacterized protein LOC129308862 [Prosopis cineraria]|uniref:uncharacterized protein LOC129308862 n=1 Tax=Prosopis cineraria TaxID=364024 RepID=UPI00240EA67B|nr:uncharacterized protein LOC129308862 [Prosopis cineraria]